MKDFATSKILCLSLMIVLTVTFISATIIYSGETEFLYLTEQFEYYSIAGNSSQVFLNVTQDLNNTVTIIPDKYSPTDNFEIIFFDSEKEIITVHHYSGGGGGGGGTRVIYKDNEVIKYIDKEIPGEEIEKIVEKEVKVEIEKIIRKSSLWIWGVIIILLGIICYMVLVRRR